jgi:hypothetical protein
MMNNKYEVLLPDAMATTHNDSVGREALRVSYFFPFFALLVVEGHNPTALSVPRPVLPFVRALLAKKVYCNIETEEMQKKKNSTHFIHDYPFPPFYSCIILML